MNRLFNDLSLVNQWSNLIKDVKLDLIQLNVFLFLPQNLTDSLKTLVIIRCQQVQRVTFPSNSGRSSASMHVYLSIIGALIVHNITNIRYIKPSSSYISAHQHSSFCLFVASFDIVHGSFESVEVLESLFLLHFGVEAEVLYLEEVQETVESTG